MSTSTRCAACRYLRRRCSEDCVLAPYFPSSHPERFACVHRIYGASNVSRMLQQLPAEQRVEAADAISSEAYWRVHDPVYGSVGVISLLQQEIFTVQRELAETQAQIIGISSAQQQNQPTAHQLLVPPNSTAQSYNNDQFPLDYNYSIPGYYRPPNFRNSSSH